MPFVDFMTPSADATSAGGEPVSVRAAYVRTVRPARRDAAFSVLEMEGGSVTVLGERREVCKRLAAALAAEHASAPAEPDPNAPPAGDENGQPQSAAPTPKGGKAKGE